MKKIISIVLAGMISTASLAEVPNAFVSGEVATAAKFNENFTSLSNEIDDVRTTVGDISDGSVVAKVNGVDMRVSSTQLGIYSIVTPTGKTISVNAEGYPPFTQLVYESSDCSGQAYIFHNQFSEHTLKPAGHVFANPKISTNISVVFSDGNLGYSLNDILTKVNYKSIDYGLTSIGCYATNGTYIASKVLPNDPAITGINSVPLVITDIGVELKISSTEVGAPVAGLFSVYASGVKIGTTTRYPDSVSDYVSVTLDGFDQAAIILYKDGSYLGGMVSSGTLYYRLADCLGDAYYLLTDDADTDWWNTTLSTKSTITNNGDYYSLSFQAYSVSQAFGSVGFDSGTCYNSIIDGSNNAYQQATLTSSSVVPTFIPPITIEGYSEPTPYNSLPVAF
ncbi:MAG: hypothetical protein KUG66_01250 [Gammaproteobacteria bacterium]|nr:hypothetical protein [Gammaproteobacteria bacterium]